MSSPNSAEVSGSPSPAPSSIGNNAPKYGTLVPNRVFVGGISASTTEQDLLELFSQYGSVKATKIISDRAGVSKGYGFVTFETEEEARRLTQEADNIMLKERKLNIAPAIKKQVSDVGYMKTYSPRLVESSNSVVGTGGPVFFGNAATYTTYGSTVPVLAPTEYPTFPQTPAAAPTTPSAYPTIMYPQPVYYPQQYQYQPTQTVQPQWGAAPQWRWITPGSYPQPECNSPCVAEPSSPPHGDFTTASAVGSLPFASTPVSLACPSTPTTTTTTVGNSTSTSAATKTVHDSLLQIKPLASTSVAAATTNGKNPQGTTRPKPVAQDFVTLASDVDKNNNTTEQGGWGKRRRHFSQYPADIPPRFLRSRPARRQPLPQQQQQHQQQPQQQLFSSLEHYEYSKQEQLQQQQQYTHQAPKGQWFIDSQEKDGGDWFGEDSSREEHDEGNPKACEPAWWCNQPFVPMWGWVMCGPYQPAQQHTEGHEANGLEWLDAHDNQDRMGVPAGPVILVSPPQWGDDPRTCQPNAFTGISHANVPFMDFPWVAPDSSTYLPINPQSQQQHQQQHQQHQQHQQQHHHHHQQQAHLVASNGLLTPQRISSLHQSPITPELPSPGVTSRRGILLGSPNQSSYSPQQGYNIVVVSNTNQQQCQLNDFYQQHTQHQQQEQQSHEQPYPGDGWLSEPIPGPVPWEWGKSSDIWVYEPKSSCDDALLPVWGDSRTLLPVALTNDDAVAYDPSAINTLQCPESDPNNNIPGNVWAIPSSVCCAPQSSQPWAQCSLQSARGSLQVHGRNDQPLQQQQQQQPSSWSQQWQSQLLEQNEFTHWYASAPPGPAKSGDFVWDASCGPQAGRWPQVNPV
ncbi:mastermind-like domain-containing protein 1 [Penaeus japonicus]|uniref:mastermind-like domain-containing protein 1 n=1 Tax=Penaeus japonicus TaxID=27405 RepID=UPI001C712695|nr:mastermind-like domain-containing protein 1 [Penaeus japonicus]